jgi:hypothetical protein
MHTTLTTLINRLESPALSGTEVIRWGCPVPSFGDLSTARVATLGLNPSNREFVDMAGRELRGAHRRFHTLRSLGLSSWVDVNAGHLRMIMDSCSTYFRRNPYDTWFRRLDQLISGTKASYYDVSFGACHLDLIPYATQRKWTELSTRQRSVLLAVAADTLGVLLRDSPVQILILNGRSVVEGFQDLAGISLVRRKMSSWSLRRRSKSVAGFAYTGVMNSIAGIGLGHKLVVVGFNHNLQSSFGVTTELMRAIRDWVARIASQVIQ